MSTIQKYFERVPKNATENNVYARSLKRKFSALTVGESNYATSKKPNSDKMSSALSGELDERECILVSTDENLPPDITSVSTKELNSLLGCEKNHQRQIHEKVSSN